MPSDLALSHVVPPKWSSEGICYARTGRSSRREVSLSGVGSDFSALATYDASMW